MNSLSLDQENPSSSTHPPPPPTSFLTGSWYVIQSTLPMWRDKRNVCITYTALPAANAAEESVPRLDDVVEYQARNSDKVKTVHGVDTPSGLDTRAWDWRGKGWLKIASSHWEFVEWSEEIGQVEATREQWAVIWFQKTLFTPEGIDIFSREKEGLGEKTINAIKNRLGEGRHKTLSEGLSEVERS